VAGGSAAFDRHNAICATPTPPPSMLPQVQRAPPQQRGCTERMPRGAGSCLPAWQLRRGPTSFMAIALIMGSSCAGMPMRKGMGAVR
jgi:hypothetical protein